MPAVTPAVNGMGGGGAVMAVLFQSERRLGPPQTFVKGAKGEVLLMVPEHIMLHPDWILLALFNAFAQ